MFVFDELTKGVDIGAKSDIFRIIGDRIAIMYDVKIIKEFARSEVEKEQLRLYASGGEEVHS